VHSYELIDCVVKLSCLEEIKRNGATRWPNIITAHSLRRWWYNNFTPKLSTTWKTIVLIQNSQNSNLKIQNSKCASSKSSISHCRNGPRTQNKSLDRVVLSGHFNVQWKHLTRNYICCLRLH